MEIAVKALSDREYHGRTCFISHQTRVRPSRAMSTGCSAAYPTRAALDVSVDAGAGIETEVSGTPWTTTPFHAEVAKAYSSWLARSEGLKSARTKMHDHTPVITSTRKDAE